MNDDDECPVCHDTYGDREGVWAHLASGRKRCGPEVLARAEHIAPVGLADAVAWSADDLRLAVAWLAGAYQDTFPGQFKEAMAALDRLEA